MTPGIAPPPRGYETPEVLDLCGNLLRNVESPIQVDELPTILVGKGQPPRVWIAGAVANNQPVKDGVQVIVQKGETICTHNGQIVLKLLHDPHPIVTELDLRTLGMEIWGDRTGLNVYGSNYAGNEISDMGTMVFVFSESRRQAVQEAMKGNRNPMEQFVLDVLERQGYLVERRSKDSGIDFIVETDEGRRWAVEAKSGNTNAAAIRQLIAAMHRNGADSAALITLGSVARDARRIASEAGVHVIAGNRLYEFLAGWIPLKRNR